MDALVDRFGRTHTYLRLSVTDRCNYRCVYCLPPEGVSLAPRASLLTFEEIARLVEIFVSVGIRRVRLSGGEPTARADLPTLVAALSAIAGLDDLSMTTNGHLLAGLAPGLARAGLRRVNVSLDSLDPGRFAAITRGGELGRVLAGIAAARRERLLPVKINAVLLEGVNDGDVEDLVRFCDPDEMELRFIEYMPFEERRFRSVPAWRVRERLGERYTLRPRPRPAGGGPAATWTIEETGLTVGFVSPLTEHFCAGCNRLRLTADGHLRTCLAHEDTPSLRDLVRGGTTDDALSAAIREMVLGKPAGHGCTVDGGALFEGVMTTVGG